MPNTPARIGNGMTVWYATPATTEDQRAQAKSLLSALGAELEVEDEKWVAMATAISGTGPAYVFLVMEALIDAAVHLGFPRHIAHDIVIETLEGSTRFAKQSGDHPAVLRNMVTSPAGTSAAAIHELESGPPADRAVRGRLGGVPAHRRAGRPDGRPADRGSRARSADPGRKSKSRRVVPAAQASSLERERCCLPALPAVHEEGVGGHRAEEHGRALREELHVGHVGIPLGGRGV